MLEIDVSAPEPVYEQIIVQIALALETKQIGVGDRLPTIRQLATDLEINPNTVARAYQQLEEIGMISTNGRAGSVITTQAQSAYESWIKQQLKGQIETLWLKFKARQTDDRSARKIWAQAIKELKDEE